MNSLFERNLDLTVYPRRRGGAENQDLELKRQGIQPETAEEDEEENEMLQGEPSVRKGSVFAYGGPLPPS